MGSLRYAKSKGRDAENAIVETLRQNGIAAERRRLTGIQDCGDIAGWKSVMVEAKNRKRIDLAGLMDEVTDQLNNCDVRFPEAAPHVGFAVIKRKGRPDRVTDWYAVLNFGDMIDLLKKAGYR